MDALRSLVGSETRARLLATMFSQPPRAYYQRELARETGLRLFAVQRELERLLSAHIIVRRPLAGRHVYEANRRSAVYREIQEIVTKLRGPVAVLRGALERESGVELAWIFGSFASGTATAASDVDLMVIGPIAPRRLQSVVIPLERHLGRPVNEHVLTAREWSARLARRDRFISEVERTTKLWVIGSDEALRELREGKPT